MTASIVELAERRACGIIVRLLWDSQRRQTMVRYRDRKSRETFLVDVPNDRALEAFEHPNAFRPKAA